MNIQNKSNIKSKDLKGIDKHFLSVLDEYLSEEQDYEYDEEAERIISNILGEESTKPGATYQQH